MPKFKDVKRVRLLCVIDGRESLDPDSGEQEAKVSFHILFLIQ